MKAAVFYGTRDIRVEDVKKPDLRSDEVLVAPKVVGICGSDFHIFTGHWKIETPLILGHEFTGEVVETGPDVRRFKPGDRVVIEPAVTCGTCYYCNSIDTNNYFCENRPTVGFTQDGAFADFVKVPEKGLHRLPENLDFEKGSLVEPLACAIRGSDRSEVQPGDNVIVLGAGPIGLLIIMLTRLRGAARIVVSVFDDWSRVGLNFIYHPQDLGNLGIERSLGADEDVSVRVGGLVAVVHQLDVSANLPAVAGNEFEKSQDGTFINGAENEG